MVELFGIDIPAIVDEALSDGLLDATLTRRTPGTRDTADITGGTQPISNTFTAKGFIEDFTERELVNMDVEIGDRKITLIANSIQNMQVPEVGDRVFIKNETWNVMRVDSDPVNATYTLSACQ